jgi:hypothetical protein
MRKPILKNFKECGFYDRHTHRCLADGLSICLDPLLIKEEECETAREAANAMAKNKSKYVFSRTSTRSENAIETN